MGDDEAAERARLEARLMELEIALAAQEDAAEPMPEDAEATDQEPEDAEATDDAQEFLEAAQRALEEAQAAKSSAEAADRERIGDSSDSMTQPGSTNRGAAVSSSSAARSDAGGPLLPAVGGRAAPRADPPPKRRAERCGAQGGAAVAVLRARPRRLPRLQGGPHL